MREEGNLLSRATAPIDWRRWCDGGRTAAGLVDTTTGEGIHGAAMTGRLGAEAAAGARPPGTDPVQAAKLSLRALHV